MNKTILLDCDGVLSDFVGRLFDYIKHNHGVTFQKSDVTSFDIGKVPGFDKNWWDYCRLQGFVSGMDVIGDAVYAVDHLSEIADVYIATAPFKGARYWMAERASWLKDNFGFSEDRIVHTHAKHLLRGDVLVDDRREHVATFQGKGVLWDRPWNKQWAAEQEGAVRVRSWAEVFEIVKAL